MKCHKTNVLTPQCCEPRGREKQAAGEDQKRLHRGGGIHDKS